MKTVLSLAAHFNTNITVYVDYADTTKINIYTITQLVKFQLVTTQAFVQSQVSPYGIFGGKSDIETGHSQVLQVSLVSIIPHYFILK